MQLIDELPHTEESAYKLGCEHAFTTRQNNLFPPGPLLKAYERGLREGRKLTFN